MIPLELLRTFKVLCEQRHFTKAASALAMTQPGVSQQVKKLEELCGTSLIQRIGKRFTITDAGRRVLSHAEQTLQAQEKLLSDLHDDDPSSGKCRYSSPGSFGYKLFDALLKANKQCPGLIPEMTVAPNASIAKMLLDEKIDVGFMTQLLGDERIESKPFDKETLLLVMPKGFARQPDFGELVSLGFVNHPDGFHHAGRLLHANYPQEFRLMQDFPIRFFINQINRILDPVRAGLGFTVLPEFAVQQFFGQGLEIAKLRVPVSDTIYRVLRKGEKLPARYETVEKFL